MSVTTDGFITNLVDLEGELLKLPDCSIPLLRMYRSLINKMDSDKSSALELKNNGVGIIS